MQVSQESFVLELCTDEEIITFTHWQNSDAWKSKYLTKEEYIERERLLGRSKIANMDKDDEIKLKFPKDYSLLGLKYFIYKDLSLPFTSKTSQIVASCETMNRVALSIHPESNEKIEPILSVCIGAVFTIPKYRGKKYAADMIHKVNDYYDSHANHINASNFVKYLTTTLYSEVGDYYNQFGYISKPVPIHHITNFEELEVQYCPESIPNNVRYLGFEDYEDLIYMELAQTENNLNLLSANSNKFLFTVKPDLEIFKWFQCRDIYISKFFCNEIPDKFGASLKNGNHIIWHHNWIGNSLVLLKIHVDEISQPEIDLSKLLKLAITECKNKKLSQLEFWDEEINCNVFPILFNLLKEIEDKKHLYVENSSRSAIRFPSCVNPNDAIWVNNTKFCWF